LPKYGLKNIANFEDNIAYRQFLKINRQAINIARSGNTDLYGCIHQWGDKIALFEQIIILECIQ
jgi:hypothetical protein